MLDLTTIDTCCFPRNIEQVLLFLIVHLQAQQTADASAAALWAVFKWGTCQCHPLLPQLFAAAGSSNAVHEHRWYHGTAGTATQLVQKLPVSEAMAFRAHPPLPSLRKTGMGNLIFHQKSFIYLLSSCCMSSEYAFWITEEEVRVPWSQFEFALLLVIKFLLASHLLPNTHETEREQMAATGGLAV